MAKSILLDATHLGQTAPTGVELYTEALLPKVTAILLQNGCRVSWVGHQKAPASLPQSVRWIQSTHQPYWSQRTLVSLLSQERPALFFTPSGIPPIFSPVPTAMTVHDLAVYSFPGAYTAGQRLRLHWLSRHAAKKTSLIFTPSFYTKDQLIKHWQVTPEKITVTPLAAFPQAQKAESVSGVMSDSVILFIGRIEKKKNVLTLIQAFAELPDRLSVQLVLAGSAGFGADQVHTAVHDLPGSVQERILLPGYISPAQKRWLYERATICAVPSAVEGFGLPVLEAFSFGVPTLCATSGSLPEVGNEAVLYADPSKPEQWTKQLTQLLLQPELRRELVKKGETRLRHYSWEKTASATAEALLTLM